MNVDVLHSEISSILLIEILEAKDVVTCPGAGRRRNTEGERTEPIMDETDCRIYCWESNDKYSKR